MLDKLKKFIAAAFKHPADSIEDDVIQHYADEQKEDRQSIGQGYQPKKSSSICKCCCNCPLKKYSPPKKP